MPNRYAEQYYPVAYGQPMPVQGWAPASPMQPVGVYPEPQPQAYPLHQPQQFAPYPVNGQGPPIYAQPLSPGYAASGYPQPMQAYQQPVPPVAQPMSHYPYPPQRHHPQPMATVWAQQPPMSYPPAQSHGAPAAAYPQMAYPYPQHPPMQPAPAPAYNVAAEPRRGDLIPFPPRHASETARSYAEEDNGSAGAIADIRASLAEFREAVRDFTETRQKRRFL